MNKLPSLQLWQQFALGAAWVLPLVGFGVIAILPESRGFQKWTVDVQSFYAVLFCIFVLADVLFTVWYVFLRAPEDPVFVTTGL
jgi:hypothetical protein